MSRVWLLVLLVGWYSGAISKVIHPTMDWLTDVMSAAMNDTEIYTERPSDFPVSLTPPTDARDVTYTIFPSGRRHRPSYSLGYEIRRPDPSASLLTEISNTLESQGWRQTGFLIHAPNEPFDGQWDVTGEGDSQVSEWSGYWIDAQDRWVSLYVYHVDPNDPNDSQWTYVDMYLQGPGSSGAKTYWTYRSLHPEEFAFAESDPSPGGP